jgi:hypothetical protein
MADEDALSRLDTAVDEIAQMHGARVDKHQLGPNSWIVSIETEDWAVTAEGDSEAQALSNLISNAKAEGRAN